MTLTIRPARVAAVMLAVIAVLTLLSVAAVYARFGLGYARVAGLDPVAILHLDADVSIPGWYSAAALLLAAAVVALLAAATRGRDDPRWRYWAGLALALCYLSADETARLHEQSAGILAVAFERDSFFTRSWTVLAAVVVFAFVAVYARFLLGLGRRLRFQLLGAGALFVLGAVGMEVLGHYVVRRRFPTEQYGVARTRPSSTSRRSWRWSRSCSWCTPCCASSSRWRARCACASGAASGPSQRCVRTQCSLPSRSASTTQPTSRCPTSTRTPHFVRGDAHPEIAFPQVTRPSASRRETTRPIPLRCSCTDGRSAARRRGSGRVQGNGKPPPPIGGCHVHRTGHAAHHHHPDPHPDLSHGQRPQ